MKRLPSLRHRIRRGTLLLVICAVALGAYAVPRVYQLGGAIRQTLYRNYISIEAAQHMHAALHRLQVAELEGRVATGLPGARRQFMYWLKVEDHDFTEIGEPELAHDIGQRGRRLFDEVATAQPGTRRDAEFAQLHSRLDQLIAMNQAAMFKANSRAMRLGRRLTYEFALGLLGLFLVGAALSWWLALALSSPLTELAERLRGVSQRKSRVRLGPQRLAELDTVAREFNQMAEQLEQYEQFNLERLLHEKSKIEAIIEGLEDGIVLIDSAGLVTQINEVAAIVVGVEAAEALGNAFDDLNSNHPHYLRIRDALRGLRRAELDNPRVEVQLHVRGRDHSYVLKPVALRQTDGTASGTLLILQDVTYLRDQDRARTNLLATLSHELRTPLTSLALAGELLGRENPQFSPRNAELIRTILEESARMTQLTDNLLRVARGVPASIALQREPLDLERLAKQVCERFVVQMEEKSITMERSVEPLPQILGDAVKLSWVLSNLLGNALRYTPSGGRIGVSLRPENGAVRLEVQDSGPGIPADLRVHIFERFAQYGNGKERGAAGLGLAIVKDIVEAHGGRIHLKNAPRGSCFIVELPASAEL